MGRTEQIACRCGYRLPEALGKYGCPNCNGESMTDRKTRRRARSMQAELVSKTTGRLHHE